MEPSQEPVLIIGSGISGVSCAERLAALCPDEHIVILSASPMLKVISNARKSGHNLMEFDVDEESQARIEAENSNIHFKRVTVTQLDAAGRRIKLENGSWIKYKKVCLCAGGRPKLIEDKQKHVIGIRDTHTVTELSSRFENSNKVMIVGNGGIAIELVYAIKNCGIIWTIKDSSIGTTFFDAGAAKFFSNHFDSNPSKNLAPCKRQKYTVDRSSEKNSLNNFEAALGPDWSEGINLKGKKDGKSIKIEYNCEVANIYLKDQVPIEKFSSIDPIDLKQYPVFVELTNERIYGVDFIVSATGVIPNSDIFTEGNDLKIANDGGIIVDQEMRTSVNDVYAAGDICTVNWPKTENWFQMRLWTQAYQMGNYAADCIAAHLAKGDPSLYFNFEIFTHLTRFFGFKVVLLGQFNAQHLDNYQVLLRITENQEYIKVVLKDGHMKGAILIGETDLEETFENLILNQIDLSDHADDLLNPSVDIEDYFD